jgi:homogentisate 1,2-dioxygenase
MPYYRVTGEVPRKRHIRFHRPDGGLYSEELMGEEGFSSDSSLLYHTHLPTAITKSEGVEDGGQAGTVPNHPLLPRHVRTTALPAGGDLVLGRGLLFANDDVRISFVSAAAPSGLYRNSAGDEAVYIARGSAVFESV